MKTPLFALIAVVLIFNSVGCGKRTSSGYHLYASFSTVQTLKPEDPVIMAGVEIGYVESIMLDPSKSEIRERMHIQRSVVVRTDSTATIISAPSPGRSSIALDSCSLGAPAAVENAILKTSEKPR